MPTVGSSVLASKLLLNAYKWASIYREMLMINAGLNWANEVCGI